MYGVRPDIPGFHYYDKREGRELHFPDRGVADIVGMVDGESLTFFSGTGAPQAIVNGPFSFLGADAPAAGRSFLVGDGAGGLQQFQRQGPGYVVTWSRSFGPSAVDGATILPAGQLALASAGRLALYPQRTAPVAWTSEDYGVRGTAMVGTGSNRRPFVGGGYAAVSLAPWLTLIDVQPPSGPPGGGTLLTATGTLFDPAAQLFVGGRETLDSKESIPEDAWVLSPNAFDKPRPAARHTLSFTKGVPSALDGKSLDPVTLIEVLETIAGPYGIGRGIHVGDTVLGTKGRVAFEAPAAEILLNAHRELEKLVLSGPQQRIKDQVATQYGDFVHEGKQLDPVCRDIEALLTSAQQRVTGDVKIVLRPGNLFIEGVISPHSLLAATKGVYGEKAGEWTPADALGYSRILSLPGILQTRAAGGKT